MKDISILYKLNYEQYKNEIYKIILNKNSCEVSVFYKEKIDEGLFDYPYIKVYGLDYLMMSADELNKIVLDYCINNADDKNYINEVIEKVDDIKSFCGNEMLENILKIKPDYNIMNMKMDIYDSSFVKHYGLTFLIKNEHKLDFLLLSVGLVNLEKLNYILNNDELLDLPNLYNVDISIEIMKKIKPLLNDPTKKNFISKCNYIDDELIDILSDNRWDYIYKIIILTNVYDVVNNIVELKKCLNDDILINFIKNINFKHGETISLKDILSFYKQAYSLLDEIRYEKLTEQQLKELNDYFYLFVVSPFKIECIEDLDNFNKVKNDFVFNYLNDIKELKEIDKRLVIQIILGIKDDRIIERIKDLYSVIKDCDQIKLLYKIIMSNSINEIINIISNLNLDNFNLEQLEKESLSICKNNIANNLTIFDRTFDVIRISDKSFKLLVHRIFGFENKKVFMELADNIEKWDSPYEPHSFISTSLIDQYYLGIVNGKESILGFNNIKPSHILDIGTKDIYYSKELYKNKKRNPKSRYLLTEDLLRQSKGNYNEVVIKRYENKKARKPDFIFSRNKISEKDKEIASYFNVPIYLIDNKESLNIMQNHLEFLIKNNQLELYPTYLLQSYLSFVGEKDLLYENFKDVITEYETFSIIKKYNSLITTDNQKHLIPLLEKIIETYENISIMMFQDEVIGKPNYNSREMKKLIVRK